MLSSFLCLLQWLVGWLFVTLLKIKLLLQRTGQTLTLHASLGMSRTYTGSVITKVDDPPTATLEEQAYCCFLQDFPQSNLFFLSPVPRCLYIVKTLSSITIQRRTNPRVKCVGDLYLFVLSPKAAFLTVVFVPLWLTSIPFSSSPLYTSQVHHSQHHQYKGNTNGHGGSRQEGRRDARPIT